jgi:ferrous iron transport protein B
MTGFGCSIPGIMATRTLRNERDRLTTILVLPLMSCGARLPIWMLLVPAFFAPRYRAPALWGIYVVGVVLALLLALTLRGTWLRGKVSPFVLELPPYRLPTMRALLLQICDRAWMYVRKAGTVIFAVSVLMWVIASYPKPRTYEIDQAVASGAVAIGNPEAAGDRVPGVCVRSEADLASARSAEDLRASIAGQLGRFLEPALRPMGFDWRVGAGLIGAFAAKEVFVAQMGIVYALGGAEKKTESLRAALRESYPPAAGFALMLFLLVATPCMATGAITRRETGGWKWAAIQFWGLTVLGYLLATGVYQIGSLL